ncbi:hypothetical protein [Streptomyces spectabilis]|uniref:Secreted protein n=1 Tax=Streptomyces spectabilis TaxID=68270 RepID=A0A5P2XHC7_STRST|nr:hypothetical protein [Streptomyces spectabilis]MBB5102610.1 hypothetical protein [Streptomyces spectabilis]MCI3907649.1 hypothetical protein [Streptomyces spectabilis]QEV64333.1 hypothetical protein CP982_41245 [Streptomyces spectabilis]GGV30831.1 hypothetical protein GCM10010245_49890 [Streptomyces spectabilis]
MRTKQAAAGLAAAVLSGLLATQASGLGDADSESISAARTAELSHLAESYLQTRASMVTTSPQAPRRTLLGATPPMADRLEDEFVRLKAKGKMYEGVDGGYSKAVVDVTVTGSSLDGNVATLEITEDGRLYAPLTPADVAGGAPEYEEYSLPHTVTFVKQSDGSWLLSSDEVDAGSGPTPSTQLTEPDVTDDGGEAPDEDADEGRKERSRSSA